MEKTTAVPSPIALTLWLKQVGVTSTTEWRWRRAGWLKTVNICGRVYVTPQAIAEFTERAERGDFQKQHVTPMRNSIAPA
jgi:hypothetical protein